MDIKEVARSGGNNTLKKHGKEHFKTIAEKRWENYRASKLQNPHFVENRWVKYRKDKLTSNPK